MCVDFSTSVWTFGDTENTKTTEISQTDYKYVENIKSLLISYPERTRRVDAGSSRVCFFKFWKEVCQFVYVGNLRNFQYLFIHYLKTFWHVNCFSFDNAIDPASCRTCYELNLNFIVSNCKISAFLHLFVIFN